ncbi:MAG: tetratricopeptide repeat protein, partial [Patescibacteria group bacterium]
PRMGLTFSFLFVLVAVGIVTGLFITGQRYAAEIAFAKAVSLDRAGGSLDEIIAKVSQATNYNRLSDTYERALAKALLVKVKTELSPAGTEIPPEKAQQIQQLIVASMTAAKAATTISPGNVANWEMLGAVYREMSPVVEGADVLSIEATQKAIELEPASPAHFNELAQAYLVFAENARARTTDKDKTVADAATKAVADYLLKAEEALVAAIALKTDYAPAHYYLAVIYERQGRLADAVVKMETVKKYNPLDVGVAFQLGLLYLRQGNYGLAQPELERAVQLTPSYSNARWFLAAIYEQKGEMAKAVEQVQKVLELNPENELVKAKLDRLKAGVKSSGLPEPIEVDDGTVLSDN